jgi:hypothetical protein
MGDPAAMLRRLEQWKRPTAGQPTRAGDEAVHVFENHVRKRFLQLGKVGEAWLVLVPELFQSHCHLAGFVRGTLTVNVDSAAHLYELKQLLLSGLEDQLLLAARPHGLRRILLKRGRTGLSI